MSDWAGLAKRSPVLAASMSLFLLSFAGIPLTAGFIGKLSVFTAAMDSGMARWWCSRWWPPPSPRSSTCGSSWSCTSPTRSTARPGAVAVGGRVVGGADRR